MIQFRKPFKRMVNYEKKCIYDDRIDYGHCGIGDIGISCFATYGT